MTSFYANQNLTSTPNPDWSLDFYDSIPASRAGLPQALLPSVVSPSSRSSCEIIPILPGQQDIEELDPQQEHLPLATLLANLLIPVPPHCGDDAALTGLLDELAHPDEFPSLPPDAVQPFTTGWTLAAEEVRQVFSFRSTYDNSRSSFSTSPRPAKISSKPCGNLCQPRPCPYHRSFVR